MGDKKEHHKRVDWIDSAKGIAIILVVIGHVGGGYTGNYSVPEYQEFIDYLVWLIYTFHMPLFFCLSGYVYHTASNKIVNLIGYKKLIKKKTVKLMFPYYVCSTIQILIKLPLQGKIASKLSWKNILLLPIHAVDQYWFLYTLFVCFVLMALLEWKTNNQKLMLSIATGMWLATLPVNYFASSSVLWYLQILVRLGEYFIFFYLGYFLCDLKFKFTLIQAVGCSVIFFLLQKVVYFSGMDFSIFLPAIRFFLAITATITVIYIANIKKVEASKWLRYVGKNSMSIYVVHVLLCAFIRIFLYKIGITNFFVHILLGILLSISVPLIMKYMLQRCM